MNLNNLNPVDSKAVRAAGVENGKVGVVVISKPRKDGTRNPDTFYVFNFGAEAISVYDDLMNADSAGTFFSKSIAGRIPYESKTVLN
jgi:hypothetical protein